jgi:hypothetical protein
MLEPHLAKAVPASTSNDVETGDRPASERYLTWLAVALAAVLFAMLARPLWTNCLYTYDDWLGILVPWRYLYSQALKAGDNVLWSPDFYCGYYIHGAGEIGICHPLHWLLYRTLPFEVAFNLEFALNYALLFAGMFVLLRRWVGRTLSGSAAAGALVGATIFTFSGFSVLHFMHMNALSVVAQLPWLLFACDVLTGSGDLRKVALAQLAIALLTASQNLMGYPNFVILSLVCEGFFVLWRVVATRRWVRGGLYLLAVALGFVASAVQLLPTWDALSLSDRANTSVEFRTWGSMHPLNVIQLWAPFTLKERYYADVRVLYGNTHEMGLYTTAFSTVALAWLAIRWRKLPQRNFILATFAFAVFMLFMAFGKYGGVYLLVTQLPVLNSFPLRCPCRYSMLTELAMSVLAAYAMADLVQLQRRKEKEIVNWLALLPLAIPLGLAAVTAAVALTTIRHPDDPWTPLLGSATGIAAGFVLIAGAVCLTAAAARGARWALYGIVLFTAAEIGVFEIWQYLWNPPQEKLPGVAASSQPGEKRLPSCATLPEIIASISPPPPPNTGRLCHIENDHSNILAAAGYNLMKGYAALIPIERVPLWLRNTSGQVVPDIPALRLAAVHWIRVGGQDQGQWVASPAPLPRARLVCQAAACKDEDIVRAVQQINLETTALVDRKLDLEFGPQGTAAIKSDRPGRLEIESVAPTRQLLVISERYHSGWKATVDGQPVDVLRAYGEYLSCVVPAGTRHISLHFMPSSFVWGLQATLAGLAAALLLAGGTLAWARWGPARVPGQPASSSALPKTKHA